MSAAVGVMMHFTLAERVTCAIGWLCKSRLFLAALPSFKKDIRLQRRIERRFLHTHDGTLLHTHDGTLIRETVCPFIPKK